MSPHFFPFRYMAVFSCSSFSSLLKNFFSLSKEKKTQNWVEGIVFILWKKKAFMTYNTYKYIQGEKERKTERTR